MAKALDVFDKLKAIFRRKKLTSPSTTTATGPEVPQASQITSNMPAQGALSPTATTVEQTTAPTGLVPVEAMPDPVMPTPNQSMISAEPKPGAAQPGVTAPMAAT